MKHIYIISDPRFYVFREGFFAAFCGLLGILPTLEKYKLKPVIYPTILHYSKPEVNYSMIPHYIELNYVPEQIDTIIGTDFYTDFKEQFEKRAFYETEDKIVIDFGELYKIVSGNDRYSENPDFTEANQLFFKYYRISNKIIERVKSFFPQRLDILGLHYRGSDKVIDKTQNPNILNPNDYLLIIEDYIIRNRVEHIFIATDSNYIISHFQTLKEKHNLTIFTTNSSKFSDGQSPFINTSVDPFKLGEDCLIDSLLLSKCNCLLLTNSALSAWSKVFNPSLESYRICKFPFKWFPLGYIDTYKSENGKIQKILDLIQN
jgi:hypothetical protein